MSDIKQAMVVATTIMDQLKAGEVPGCASGWHAMGCWGFSHPKVVQAKHAVFDDRDGLYFSVNGRFLKRGKVKVSLDVASDTYTVYFANVRNKILKELHDVKCDELAYQIDRVVESGDRA